MSGGSRTLTPLSPPVVWLDVEDLFEYARHSPRPSGIQRLAFEIYQALHGARGDTGVRFLRHAGEGFTLVEWPDVAALFGSLAACKPDGEVPEVAAEEVPAIPARRRRTLLGRLPPSLQDHVANVSGAQRHAATASRHAVRAWWGLFDAVGRGVLRAPLRLRRRRGLAPDVPPPPDPQPAPQPDAPPDPFETMARPGDILLVLGSPWSHEGYGALVRDAKERLGLRFGLLVYDLIPLRRPEWCDAGLVRMFRAWFDDVFPLCDAVFAISRATAGDVEAYAAERGIRLPGPVQPIPIGSGFAGGIPSGPAPRTARLPAPGSYALIVSTIEARKNHLLLFRIWRKLLEAHPAEAIPTLVFAGRVGWLVDDLMRQINNTQNLGGKLVLVENPSDAELAALYQGCLFTLFPSFYEGWGLPVTESLAFGKPCLIADRTSLPEAGGSLARSFDPDNLHDAYAAVEAVVMDPAGLAAWEARVRREFRPVPWSETAASLLAGLPG